MVVTWAFVVALALLGFVLLMLELFVIPGFGITGIAAIAAILGAVWYANLHLGTWQAVAVFCVTLLGSVLMISRTARTGGMKQLRNPSVSPGKVWDETRAHETLPQIGARGVAVTKLRPAGIVQIGDRRYDVTALGPIAEAGQAVEVVQIEGNHIKVKAL